MNIYRKTEEEKKELEERAALNAQSINEKETLPDAEELALVAQLREKFKDQLEKRKENGTHYEMFFGDNNMTRIIRGNDSNIDLAEKWLGRFLKNFEEFKMDEVVQDVQKSWAPPTHFTIDVLGAKEKEQITPYATFIPCHEKKANNGDLIVYMALTDLDKKGILLKGDDFWKMYAGWCTKWAICNTTVLDYESKQQGRMVKLIGIYDLKDCSIGGILNKPFDDKFDKDVAKVWEWMNAEHMRKLYILNSPWWMVQMWGVMTKMLPERLTRKVKVVDGDGQKDPEFSKLVSASTMQECFATRIGRMAGKSGEPSGEIEVKAGSDFEYALSVKEGQMVSWTFTVIKGSADMALGASDLQFGGIAFWMNEAGIIEDGEEEDEGGEVVVPQAMITAADGEVDGEIEVQQPGILTLRWDNYHGAMRGKTLKYDIKVK